MTATATSQRTAPLLTSLRARADQPQQWMIHSHPVPFVEAAALVRAAHQQDGARTDEVAFDLRTWAFGSNDQESMQLVRVPLPGRETSRPLVLRDLAFGQLCQRIGTPPAYIRDLPLKLQVACMNWGLAQAPQNALLRLAGDEVRAMMSDRYAAIDDDFLLDVVDSVLSKSGFRDDALVRATSTGPHTLLRVTVPSAGVAVRKDDIIEYGLDIANSELGLRSVQVTPITHRLICTNGMRAWRSDAALRMRHVGDPARLREQLRDAIPVAFAEARGDIARWKKATEVLISDALDEIENLRAFGITSAETQAISRSLAVSTGLLPAGAEGGDLSHLLRGSTSAFELANAITATARERNDVTARLNMESLGHRYLVSKTS
jgi:Domain of unknown function (DUF932)